MKIFFQPVFILYSLSLKSSDNVPKGVLHYNVESIMKKINITIQRICKKVY